MSPSCLCDSLCASLWPRKAPFLFALSSPHSLSLFSFVSFSASCHVRLLLWSSVRCPAPLTPGSFPLRALYCSRSIQRYWPGKLPSSRDCKRSTCHFGTFHICLVLLRWLQLVALSPLNCRRILDAAGSSSAVGGGTPGGLWVCVWSQSFRQQQPEHWRWGRFSSDSTEQCRRFSSAGMSVTPPFLTLSE